MDFALKYRDMGISVIPLRPKGKEPLLPWTEYQKRSATREEVNTWYARTPNANLGIVTGSVSGIVVVDLDGPAGIESGRRLGLHSPVAVLTGNGKQLYYRHPGGKVCNSVKKVADGVDIRGDGGYVAAPPSIHPNGKRYSWIGSPLSNSALPLLPTIFITAESRGPLPTQFSTAGAEYTGNRNQQGWIAEALKDMKHGNIDNTLHRICSRLRNDGYSESDALVLLAPHADRAGATDGHLEDKIRNVWSRYSANPKDQPVETKSESIDEFLQDQRQPEWICKPLIARKSIGFVAGLQGTLKTWLLVDLAVELAKTSGAGRWLGLFDVAPSRVLFIDQERFRGETQRRFSAVIAAKGLSRRDLNQTLFIKCGTTIKLDVEASYQAFRSELLETKPDVVIIDSLVTIHTKSEKDRTEMQLVMEKIKALRNEVGCAFIFIHHETKMVHQKVAEGNAPTSSDMSGSTAIPAAAENVLTVRYLDAQTSIIHNTKNTLATSMPAFYASVKDVEKGVKVEGLCK